MDNMEADYQAKSEMDRYENEGIDDENDLNELSVQGRMLVDQDLERREQGTRYGNRRAGAFAHDEYEEDDEERMANMKRERLVTMQMNQHADLDYDDDDDLQKFIDYEALNEPIAK